MNRKHLENKIEEFRHIAMTTECNVSRVQAEQLTEFYALAYKEMTGHYYVRGDKR